MKWTNSPLGSTQMIFYSTDLCGSYSIVKETLNDRPTDCTSKILTSMIASTALPTNNLWV